MMQVHVKDSPQLYLDWGSTNLRVYLIENCKVIDTRFSTDGAAACRSAAEFEAVFDRATEGWRDRVESVMLSGMVTRKGGWVETPYLPIPTDLSLLRASAVEHYHGALRLLFLPGLSQSEPPDVIRGEETALLGLAERDATCRVILPGTHSKWVVQDGYVVRSFRTFMTGEMYNLALKHSLAGQLAEGDTHCEQSFAAGVAAAQNRVPLASIFQARSLVLVGGADARGTASFLSGLFVATEILEAMGLNPDLSTPPIILGAEKLVVSYLLAFRQLGIEVTAGKVALAVRGIERLVTAA